jgi:Flp pilus assembly protein TadG
MSSWRFSAVCTVFTRLMRDKAGNALMLAAAAMIPLTGMVGGALDLGRIYLVKVRLQHACDAGALAGRRSMAGGAWGTDDLTAANLFFDGNFVSGAYGTSAVSRTFTQPAGGTSVHGVVSTTVPMTLMRVFAIPAAPVGVTCDSDMQMPNTDVMFVLDNTGSMACDPNGNNCNSGSTSKIYGLKNAVKCFYEVLAQLKTNGTCTATNTGTGIASGTQLRFGFVPYSTNVNIGALNLAANYYATSWPYQSRMPRWYVQSSQSSSSQPVTVSNATTNTCKTGAAQPAATDAYTTDSSANHANTWTHTTTVNSNYSYNSSAHTCTETQTVTTTKYTETEKATPGSGDVFAEWHYGKITHSLASFNTGSAIGTSAALPIGASGVSRTVAWDGCSEEAAATSNINTVATGQLAPALPDALFLRAITSSISGATTTDQYTASDYYNSVRSALYYCPTAAQPLQTWATSVFDNYVDTLVASGNTYHDVGMLWGGRLLSPEGIYSASNTTTSTGGQIQRHMIFMTDGDAQASSCDYQQFGIAWWDKRTDSNVGSASNCTGVNTALTTDVNTRLVALCTAVKAEPNTILWVISFGGTGIATDTKTRLQACATDTSHYFDATSNASLQTAFQTIAAKIAQLRIIG